LLAYRKGFLKGLILLGLFRFVVDRIAPGGASPLNALLKEINY
tara:strand:- start:373 stop:501 length:129 start_codon:yes stop_codon:yes gene_type:complete